MERNRAWRRQQKATKRAYTRAIVKIIHPTATVKELEKFTTDYEKNRKYCSCPMCGNYRRGNGKNDKTMQERRHHEDHRNADPS